MKPRFLITISVIALFVVGFSVFRWITAGSGNPGQVAPTPTPAQVEQLPAEKQPRASLSFTADGHFVTVKITNLFAAGLEYNLIYDALVKKNRIQTGVTGSADVTGLSEYTNKQLLGSESSGKFTYHESISNAVLELTLRNDDGYSIYSATYPFAVSAGKSIDLTPLE